MSDQAVIFTRHRVLSIIISDLQFASKRAIFKRYKLILNIILNERFFMVISDMFYNLQYYNLNTLDRTGVRGGG